MEKLLQMVRLFLLLLNFWVSTQRIITPQFITRTPALVMNENAVGARDIFDAIRCVYETTFFKSILPESPIFSNAKLS
jgi:hypothetical protein